MNIPLYQIDSFTTELFSGNPAGVVPLDRWLSEETLQAIAAENNVAATAFYTPSEGPNRYKLRWFTPTTEIPLCAHGSIAAAWVICEAERTSSDHFVFETQAGDLAVERVDEGQFKMDFPIDPYDVTPIDNSVADALGKEPSGMLRARYSVAIYDSEQEVRDIVPDIQKIAQCHHAKRPGAVVITAPADSGREYDFVSRFFAPGVGVDEDPVTGSAHCILAGYWADRLGRSAATGYQCSQRGGTIHCEVAGERVFFMGHATLYAHGQMNMQHV